MGEDDVTIESDSPHRDANPERIGRYRILGVIGDGGFGRVYEAEQTEPVRRRVAVKVIKAGMDSKQVLARFEAERQALAVMDHPGIAKFLDADLTEQGRPYFVMEFVRGVPITDFGEQERLRLEDRVRLMIQVCRAVQHAHMKGVIHRDLKPSNVLVELIDQKPVVKVIDFGVAKALVQPLTGSTLYTERGQLIGTPEYMSPEQARGSGVDVDTRADVYSLGAILYELLTGLTPFDSSSLRSKGYAELQRIIEREEAPRPSLRLSTIGKTPGGSGKPALHSIDPAAMSRHLKGDMDWIVMKCLEKERDRRYDTANALAMDLQRYLDDEPVVAGPPSIAYRARKFVKRNKALVTGGVLVAAALVLGIAGTTWGMLRAIEQKQRAEEAEAATQHELERATEIKRLVTEMLSGVDPDKAQGVDTTLLRGILDDASERLANGEIKDELVAAELHHVIGLVYSSLGLYAQAEQHTPAAVEIRTRLLGEEAPDTLFSVNALANLYRVEGRLAEAEPLYLRTLESMKRVLGEDNEETLTLAGNIAVLYQDQGRFAEAEPIYLATLAAQKRVLGEEHPDTLRTMNNLAIFYRGENQNDKALAMGERTLELRRRVLGDSHPDTLMSMAILALLDQTMGRYDDAIALTLECLERRRKVLGPEDRYTLGSESLLGLLYLQTKRFDEAAAVLEDCVPVMRRVLGTGHAWTRAAMRDLADALAALGRNDRALALRRELRDLRVAAAEQPDADLATINEAAWNLLTAEPETLRDPARALQFARRACARAEAEGNGALMYYLDTLALAQHMTGDDAAAVESQRRCIALFGESADPEMKASLAEYEAALAKLPEKTP